MDARTVELGAAALGHAPPSDLLRQVLAGRGPAHTAPASRRHRRQSIAHVP